MSGGVLKYHGSIQEVLNSHGSGRVTLTRVRPARSDPTNEKSLEKNRENPFELPEAPINHKRTQVDDSYKYSRKGPPIRRCPYIPGKAVSLYTW